MPNVSYLFLLTTVCCIKATQAASIIPDYPMHEGIIDIHPYISAETIYDSNIFRLESGARAKQLFGSSNLSDMLFELEFGIATKVRLSRQLVSLDLNANETKYNRFSNLDYAGNNEHVQWDWILGNDINGVLSYNKSKQDSGFEDVVSSAQVVRKNNLRTTDTTHADIKVTDKKTGEMKQQRKNNDHYKFTNGDLRKGHWVQFLLDAVWKTDATGMVKVYRRDEGESDFQKVLQLSGIPTLQTSQYIPTDLEHCPSCAPVNIVHYWRVGYYRSTSPDQTNVLWLGPVVRGTTFDEVAKAAFGTSGSKIAAPN